MKKINFKFVSALIFNAFFAFCILTNAKADLPAGYCQVGCKMPYGVPAFDFAKKAAQAGDPNTGKPLGPTTLIPDDEGQGASKSVNTSDLLGNLGSVENWSAGSCGKSLNDDSWNEVAVVAPCSAYNSMLDRKALIIKGKHKSEGTPPPSTKVGDQFFQAASSPAAQKALDEEWYCRAFMADGSSGDGALKNNVCQPYDFIIGDNNIFGVGMQSKVCRSVTVPGFVPQVKYPVGGGFLGCRKGIPDGAQTSAYEWATYGIGFFGKYVPILDTANAQSAPIRQKVTQVSNAKFAGKELCPQNVTLENVTYEKPCPVYHESEETSISFAVGPIPITVDVGIVGDVAVNQWARVAPMWANGHDVPGFNISAYAKAYVNLVIAKAGVEANLTVLNDIYDLYGFSGVAFLPEGTPGLPNGKGFYFSEQLVGSDTITALAGNVAAFAKIPVPKFLGWKWKKYRYTIFSWPGLVTKGYVINQISGPTGMAFVKNN